MSRYLLLFALFATAPLLRAQSDMPGPLPDVPAQAMDQGISTVQGQVHFSNGKPADSVTVSLVSLDDGTVRRTRTDSSGFYEFLNLKTGDYQYEVVVQQQGFMPVRERVISCDMAPVSLFVTLIPFRGGAEGEAAAAQPKIPKNAQAEYQKGLSAMNGGETEKAATHFSKAVGICPFYFDSYLKLAAAEADEHQFAEAQKMIDRALRLNKNSSSAYAYLGYLRMREGKTPEAKKQFQHAIELRTSDWFAQLELGRILLTEKQPQEAYLPLVTAHQLHPQLTSVHLLFYDDLIMLDKKQEALAELNDILARFPHSPEAARLRKVRGALEAAAGKSH
jgi:tetratricopeptide (TPR) repeat protein